MKIFLEQSDRKMRKSFYSTEKNMNQKACIGLYKVTNIDEILKQPLLTTERLGSQSFIRLAVIILSLLSMASVLAKNNLAASNLTIRKGKNFPVCQEVVKKIKSTPDFFNRFEKEGYKYILFDSPFKRDDIEFVPKALYYAAYSQARAFKLIKSVHGTLNLRSKRYKDACSDYPKHLQECEKIIMNSSLKIESEKIMIDFLTDAFLENERAFAYKTKTNVYSHSKIEEYALGVVGNRPYGEHKGNSFGDFEVVDRYMRLHPDVNFNKKNGTVKSTGVFAVVPVDLLHRTFSMELDKSEGYWVIYIEEGDFSNEFGGLSTLVCRISD